MTLLRILNYLWKSLLSEIGLRMDMLEIGARKLIIELLRLSEYIFRRDLSWWAEDCWIRVPLG
jgi:hypothetical protein